MPEYCRLPLKGEKSMRELTCIVCPMGCRIKAYEEKGQIRVEDHGCRRGELYARDELTAPKRVVTSVVTVQGCSELLPVKTPAPVPKEAIFRVMEEVRRVVAKKPVRAGDVLVENIAGTGVALIATKHIQ